jgi:hypothetical protein
MIILDDASTWDRHIHEVILENLSKINDEITNMRIAFSDDPYGSAFVNGSMSNYNAVVDMLSVMLNDFSIRAYHCTRVMDFNEIALNGLRKLNIFDHCDYIFKILRKCSEDYDFVHQNVIKALGKYKDNRENMVWFVLNTELIFDRGCYWFYNYFGGEAFRRIIEAEFCEDISNKIIKTISTIGSPCFVEMEIPIQDIENYKISGISKQMIDHYLKLEFGEHAGHINSKLEGYIKRDVKAAEILQIYDVSKLLPSFY